MWAVLVIWKEGDQEYLHEGNRIATFRTRKQANSQREFLLVGMEGDVQSINVVKAPKETRRGM